MNILWLSHLIPYPPKGGVLQRSHYLLKEVSKFHNIDLLAFNQVDLMQPLFKSVDAGITEATEELEKYCNQIQFFDIPCDRYFFGKHLLAIKSLFTKDPYNINWLKSDEYKSAITQLIYKKHYDAIHFDCISLIPYLDLAGSIPVVLDHHNIESHMLLRRADKESSKIKAWYYRQEGKRLKEYEKKACPNVSLNITCSKMDTVRLLDIASKSKCEDIPNGVDEEYFYPVEKRKPEHRLLFVGTLSWYPNSDAVHFIAQRIWPILKQDNIIIDIVGANPPQAALKLADNEANFKVHGFVDDVRDYFTEASIFICPISDGGGTKLKVLDAMAMGKAIIAHPIACEGIEVEDGLNIVFAESPEDYVKQVKIILSDDHFRLSLGNHARTLVEEKYTYKAIAKKLAMSYEALCSQDKSIHK